MQYPEPAPMAFSMWFSKWPQTLRRALWLTAIATLVVATSAHAEPAPIEITAAEFRGVGLDGPVEPAHAVSLPDTWAQRDASNRGRGRYLMRFTLAELPTRPWALSLARVSSSRRVFLNGVLVEDESPGGRENPKPDVISLPTQLLAAGPNTLEIELRYRARAGLSRGCSARPPSCATPTTAAHCSSASCRAR